jgi:predicted O-linked N-acetylglucosamine transferase (SPINDLY family)
LAGAYFKTNQIYNSYHYYKLAFDLKPDHEYLFGMYLLNKALFCDWFDYEEQVTQLEQKLISNSRVVTPFTMSALIDSLELQKKASTIWSSDQYSAELFVPLHNGPNLYKNPRIKIAFVSCDFRVFPATFNNIQIWERLDRTKFEVIAISYGPVFQEDATAQGQMRSRLVKAFDQFLDLGDKSDAHIAQLMRDMEVDIAVDLSGVTLGGRQGILAHRPAPVQVNLYGFTSGAPYIDYIMATQVMIPPEHQHGFTEKVVYLPDTSIGVDTSRQVSNRQFTRGELGLPESGVVYCSFNNAYKFNPQMFDVWMRVLLQVPGSVLWLQSSSQEKVKENLSREAQARGVDPSRLVFAEKIESMADHLARHRAADVFLDTLPFNAQTTATDALWAGLPVLTCLGQSSFARVAGSVLMALGMPELVMRDLQAYEAMAVRIGTDSELVKQLKDKLNRQKLVAPLFDVERLTQHYAQAFEQMHQRVVNGLSPKEIDVLRIPRIQDAMVLHGQGKLKQAQAVYLQVLENNPNNSDARHLLGVIAYQSGLYEEAAVKIASAIELNPRVASYHSNHGLALKELKKFEAAVVSYDKALS